MSDHVTAPDSAPARFAWVSEAARDTLAPLAARGPHGRVDPDLTRALGETGILATLFPEPTGETMRPQASAREICELRERVAYHCVAAEVALAMQGIGGYPVLQSGQQHHLDEWLPKLRSGEAVAAFALTEPECGSDAAALQLKAVPEGDEESDGGDGWLLHGTKTWISNAPGASFYVTFARTSGETGARGVTAFLVPADRAGLGQEEIDLIAPHPIGTLTFDGVRVGPEDVLGEVGKGFRVAMQTFDLFRPSVGSAAIGMAQFALDTTVEHAATREMFGAYLGSKQAVAHQLADAATSLHASRLLVGQAADAYDAGSDRVTAFAAMAKLYASEASHRVVDMAVQLHGAKALEQGHPIGALYTEIRASRIFEGASEVQRDLIARDLFRGTALDHRANKSR